MEQSQDETGFFKNTKKIMLMYEEDTLDDEYLEEQMPSLFKDVSQHNHHKLIEIANNLDIHQ